MNRTTKSKTTALPPDSMDRRQFILDGMTAAAALTFGTLPLRAAALGAVESPASPDLVTLPTRIYPTADAPNGLWPVQYRKALPPTAPRVRYPGFAPGTTLLKAGTLRREGAQPLSCNIVFERDVALKLRDGTSIYADIFRPEGEARVPAIFAWSPYGKALGGQWLDDLPNRSGVPLNRVSELQRFEGADPAYWCAHGYAVVNPDPRGALKSEGNITFWGRQVAEDGYDVVEWIATRPWCSGAVVMSGNSALAISQWFTAAEQPPHLKAIAPWEGFCESGPAVMPEPILFSEIILQSLGGGGYIQDQTRMLLDNPLMNAYWEDGRAKLDRIKIPAYIVASYTHPAHTVGTFAAWRGIASKDKWLRVHNTQEWQDYYDPANVEDLRRFFDHYAKGVDNGWPKTPRVRLSVLDPGGSDTVNRPEADWPLPRARAQRLHLHADSTLGDSPEAAAERLSWHADGGGVKFRLRFAKTTELIGHMRLRLWVQAEGADDMDLTFSVRKAPQGMMAKARDLLPGPPGTASNGLMRVSMRELDAVRSSADVPVLAMRREQRLKPGQIVPIDVALSPMAMRFRAGDELELSIAPFRFPPFIPITFGEFKVPVPADSTTFEPDSRPRLRKLGGSAEPAASRLAVKVPATRNAGTHILHFGAEFDSWLQVFEA